MSGKNSEVGGGTPPCPLSKKMTPEICEQEFAKGVRACLRCKQPMFMYSEPVEAVGPVEPEEAVEPVAEEPEQVAEEPEQVAEVAETEPAQTEPEPLPAEAPRPEPTKDEPSPRNQKPTPAGKICVECGRPRKRLVGRGLCGMCYPRLKKSGELDTKYPVTTHLGMKPRTVAPSRTDAPDKTPAAMPTIRFSAARRAVPTTAAPPDPTSATIVLRFDLEDERDLRLYESLQMAAKLDRRTLDAETMVLLETATDGQRL